MVGIGRFIPWQLRDPPLKPKMFRFISLAVLFGVLCHVTILVTWYKEGFSRAEKLSSMSMSLTQTSFLQIQNTAALLGGKLSRNRSKLSMGNSSFRGGEIRATNGRSH